MTADRERRLSQVVDHARVYIDTIVQSAIDDGDDLAAICIVVKPTPPGFLSGDKVEFSVQGRFCAEVAAELVTQGPAWVAEMTTPVPTGRVRVLVSNVLGERGIVHIALAAPAGTAS